ncbi:MAG: ABC transporter permease, partial [Alphaproteobacteria bacterium]|nr:ABC transporter permease [Alphaproteobacteria bacterium]
MKIPRPLFAFVIIYLVFLYAPVILLPVFSLNDSPIIAFPLKGMSFRWFIGLMNESTLGIALKNSIIIAVSAAVISTFLGVLAARAAARYEF